MSPLALEWDASLVYIHWFGNNVVISYIKKIIGVAESGDDFTKFSTISQWFQTLIHPLIPQRPII
ncbi:MAG: hypothetical protein HRU34_16600 [Richelia sp.]|nr:hypothetical protein [Richelia sp.]CDN11484.1 Mobile element protein [Richelia intracellularis]